MNPQYTTDSASTANFPPLFVIRSGQTHLHCEELESEIGGGIGLHLDDTTTSRLPVPQSQPAHQDISTAILNVNRYIASNSALVVQRGCMASTIYGLEFKLPKEAQLTVQSQGTVTQSSTLRPTTALPVNTPSSTSRAARETLSLVIDKWAVRLATEKLKKARDAATAGDLRLAYRNVYRGLDELFRRGKWEIVSAELAEICKETYPATFGIGAMRFSSEASKYIPGWRALLNTLGTAATRQGMDIRRAMRGLLNNDGNP